MEEIAKIEPLWRDTIGEPYWFLVKLKGKAEEFALHRNYFMFYGNLKTGDKVEYVVSKCKMGKNGSRGINEKGYLLFDKIRKIEKKKEKWEEGKPEL